MVFTLREKDLGGRDAVLKLRSSGMGKVGWGVGWTVGVPAERTAAPELSRTYLQAPPIVDGKPVKEGLSTVRIDKEFRAWKNPTDRVETGRAIVEQVELHLLPSQVESVPFFVMEEPLPGGVAVCQGDIQGDFDFVEKRDGRLLFYCSTNGRAHFVFRFKLRGVLPGTFRVLPTRFWPLSSKAKILFGKATTLKVVEGSKAAFTKRRATPDELFFTGIRRFDQTGLYALRASQELLKDVKAPLEACFESFGARMYPKPFFELGRRLLAIRLIRGKGRPILELFEKLKDARPDFSLSFEDMSRVGRAYFEAGEFERSLYVYQAVSEALFLREVQVAGTLREKGRLEDSLQVMRGLFLDYPALPEIQSALFSLAQGFIALAARKNATSREESAFRTKDQLLKQARDLCYEYLLRYPADGDAAEVCYSLVNIAIEGKQWEEALTLLPRAIKAYEDSPWLDEFLFLNGYALFLKKDFDAAREVLDRVAHENFVLQNGQRGKSPNRFLALFLEGQCEHARGNVPGAVALYSRVAEHFREAKDALSFFEDKMLKLPEVTLLSPDEEAGIKLKTRNLSRIDLLVYHVDLMRLFLVRRSLADMDTVQLLGIPPMESFKVDLKNPSPYIDHEQEVPLKLEKNGAYLLLAQAGNLKNAGLLLKSDLKLKVQQLPKQNRVRLNVKRKGLPIPGARIKIVRAESDEVLSGKTDLRGVFVGEGLQGGMSALVESKGQYAFYQSPIFSHPPYCPAGVGPKPKREDLLRNNRLELRKLQERGGKSLDRLFRNQQQGVELGRTK